MNASYIQRVLHGYIALNSDCGAVLQGLHASNNSRRSRGQNGTPVSSLGGGCKNLLCWIIGNTVAHPSAGRFCCIWRFALSKFLHGLPICRHFINSQIPNEVILFLPTRPGIKHIVLYPETNEFAETHADAAKVCTMTPSGCQTPCSTHCDWAGLLLLQTFGMPCTNGSHSHSQETCCMGFELPSCPLPWLRRPRQLYLYSGGMHWGAEQSHIT